MDSVLVEMFKRFHKKTPGEIVLSIDVTDDPLHGEQEGISITATTARTDSSFQLKPSEQNSPQFKTQRIPRNPCRP